MDSINNTEYILKGKTGIFFKNKISPRELNDLLIKDPTKINSIDEKGETLLSNALNNNQKEIYDIILNSPSLNLKYKDNNGNSYIHLAVMNQNEKVVKALIKKGINLNMQNKLGNTALHLAYELGDNEIITLLTNNGINTLIKNNNRKKAKEMNEIKIKKNKSEKNCVILNKTTRNNLNGFYLLNPKRKIQNDFIKNKNTKIKKNKIDKDNSIFKIYTKFIGNDTQYINDKKYKKIPKNLSVIKINKKKFGKIEKIEKMDNIENIDDLYINDEKSIKLLFKEYKYYNTTSNNTDNTNTNTKNNNKEEKDCIKKVENKDYNNLLNNTSKETKFLTEGKEKTINVEISSSIMSRSSESKINNNNNNSNKNVKQNTNKFIIYDRNYLTDRKIKENTLGVNNKSFINIINKQNNQKWKTIQNKISPKAKSEKATTDKIFKYKISNKLNSEYKKSKSNKNNNIYTSKIINKTIGLSGLKNQKSFLSNRNSHKKSFINNLNLDNNNNKNKNKIFQINQILKKRNVDKPKFQDFTTIHEKTKKSASFIDKKKNKIFSQDIKKNDVDENLLTMKSSKLLKDFLSQINMDEYLPNFSMNGFDDINLILEQSKNGISSIKDNELKEAGIQLPGDRAKILIRIQELSNNFNFPIPQNIYDQVDKKNIENDKNVHKLKEWLQNLKVDLFFNNFLKGGYYSLELLFIQMASSNPINGDILKDDLGIEKVGYRTRIINRLKDDSKKYIDNLKLNMLVINGGDEKGNNCECIIF